jgi:ankyrin repeat protein
MDNNDEESAKLLTEHGAVAYSDVFEAAAAGTVDDVRIFLERGINANTKDDGGETLLDCAVSYDDLDLAELLISHGADVNTKIPFVSTLLHWAVERSGIELIKVLVTKGADIQAKDSMGITPLHCAAKNDDVEIAKLLISLGADVNVRNDEGGTPLHEAVDRGNLEFIKLLVCAGANVDGEDNKGRTPLHVANWNGNPSIVDYLISQGAGAGGYEDDDVSMNDVMSAIINNNFEETESLLRWFCVEITEAEACDLLEKAAENSTEMANLVLKYVEDRLNLGQIQKIMRRHFSKRNEKQNAKNGKSLG